ncbi:MAG: hypothetical protein FWE41_09345, partial [Coriobacteriia bacterium]|nr:hypothetical protein [Coriobacteriia bacterium]
LVYQIGTGGRGWCSNLTLVKLEHQPRPPVPIWYTNPVPVPIWYTNPVPVPIWDTNPVPVPIWNTNPVPLFQSGTPTPSLFQHRPSVQRPGSSITT